MIPFLTKTQIQEVSDLQNNALRFINNIKLIDKISIETLHQTSNIEKIENRLLNIRTTYIKKAIEQNNPLIGNTLLEYLKFKGGKSNNKSVFSQIPHNDLICMANQFIIKNPGT